MKRKPQCDLQCGICCAVPGTSYCILLHVCTSYCCTSTNYAAVALGVVLLPALESSAAYKTSRSLRGRGRFFCGYTSKYTCIIPGIRRQYVTECFIATVIKVYQHDHVSANQDIQLSYALVPGTGTWCVIHEVTSYTLYTATVHLQDSYVAEYKYDTSTLATCNIDV